MLFQRAEGSKHEDVGKDEAIAMGVEIAASISSNSHALRTSGRATNLQVDFELPLA